MTRFVLPPPTPEQRINEWCSGCTWTLFGDFLPGYPSWHVFTESWTLTRDKKSGEIFASAEGSGLERRHIADWETDEEGDIIITLSRESEYFKYFRREIRDGAA